MNRTPITLLPLIIIQNCVLAEPADESASARIESETLFVRRIGPLLREKCFGRRVQSGSSSPQFENRQPQTDAVSILIAVDWALQNQPLMGASKPAEV